MTPLPKVSEVASKKADEKGADKTEPTPGAQSETSHAKEEKIAAVLFLAGYLLSDPQKQKLESMSGLPVVAIKEWANKNNIDQYSERYHSIALPSYVESTVLNICKNNCAHVYQAIKKKGEKNDSGWKSVK